MDFLGTVNVVVSIPAGVDVQGNTVDAAAGFDRRQHLTHILDPVQRVGVMGITAGGAGIIGSGKRRQRLGQHLGIGANLFDGIVGHPETSSIILRGNVLQPAVHHGPLTGQIGLIADDPDVGTLGGSHEIGRTLGKIGIFGRLGYRSVGTVPVV